MNAVTVFSLAVNLIILVVLIFLIFAMRRDDMAGAGNDEIERKMDEIIGDIERIRQDSRNDQEMVRSAVSRSVNESVGSLGNLISQNMKAGDEYQRNQLDDLRKTMESRLDDVRSEVDKRMNAIQADTGNRLDEMRKTVDEKLEQTINSRMTESFKLVNDRLEQVYKGLGEMQNLAQGVGDLKKVMSNVKTRGILGEVQLGAIFDEILSPVQYETNVVTKKGSGKFVEYAVKLPSEDGSFTYLPVDSKFPGESYGNLCDAYEEGNAEKIIEKRKVLLNTIKAEAKDIRDKYIDPPHTTEFAVMFLPFEGLYAEVVNQGMLEELQRDYHVNIAGPSTMAAFLNSLQMGFRTFAIQKRSGEVWQVLGAVKTEFDKFAGALEAAQNRINQANSDLEKLVGTRTRQMQRKLRSVTELEESEAGKLLYDEKSE